MNQTKLNRRDFFKNLPRLVLNGFQPETTAVVPRKPVLNISRCLAWGNMSCQACYLACPLREKAIEMRDQKPLINIDQCDGCTLCVDACRTVNDPPAISMKAL